MLNRLRRIKLPNKKLKPEGKISHILLQRNIVTFWSAINYVKQLPYGRVNDHNNYLAVLEQMKGTCSTKHALIAALAQELEIDLDLTLGLFILTADNIPQLTTILKTHQVNAICEAHCYLIYRQQKLDITFPALQEFARSVILPEKTWAITPNQIGDFKVARHQEFIRSWLKDKPEIQFAQIWQAREQWIKQLSTADESYAQTRLAFRPDNE